MKVILAKNAGFCMGVRRAVETTLDVINHEPDSVATFGPLIHNPQVLGLLEERGVRILEDIPEQQSGTVVIRAHGVPPEQKEKLQASGARVKDATCPHVVRVQVIIKKYRKQGYGTVIIGDRNHAEVEGLMGYAGEAGHVVSCRADIDELTLTGPYIIVSQTTQGPTVFAALSKEILDRFPNGEVFKTICDSTHQRQGEVRELCGKAKAIVVVGGRNSANTRRLGEIVEGMGCKAFTVETEEELDRAALSRYDCVGVTAGASTPTWMINRVVRYLEAIPGQGEGMFRIGLYRFFWLLLVTNFYVAAAGGFLAYAAVLLQGIEPLPAHFLISFGYLFSMHNLNRFVDQKSREFNDPIRAFFYHRFRWPLLMASALALVLALTLARGLGQLPFLLLIVMSVFGVLYSVRFIPAAMQPLLRVRRLKEIPGSKTFLVALAWAFVTTLVPSWTEGRQPDRMTAGAVVFVFLLAFVRNALFDVFEVQADRVLGKETLPVCIGERKTMTILHLCIGLLITLLLVFPWFGWITPLGYWLLPPVFYLIGLVYLYEKESVAPGSKLELALDSLFFLMAGFAWLGTL